MMGITYKKEVWEGHLGFVAREGYTELVAMVDRKPVQNIVEEFLDYQPGYCRITLERLTPPPLKEREAVHTTPPGETEKPEEK